MVDGRRSFEYVATKLTVVLGDAAEFFAL